MDNIIIEHDSSHQLIHFEFVVNAGRLAEPKGLPGLAYLTSRLLLRGTQKLAYRKLMHQVEKLGGSLASASDQDKAYVTGVVIKNNFEEFIRLLFEILLTPAFDPHEFKIVKKLIGGELKNALSQPQTLAKKALLELMYQKTSLASSVKGTLASLHKITLSQVKDFFNEFWCGQNMLCGLAGDLRSQKNQHLLELLFKNLPQGKLFSAPFPVTPLKGRHAVIVHRQDMATVPLYMAIPGVCDSDPDLLPLEVANFIFGDDFTSRLSSILRQKNGWTYGAYSRFTLLMNPKKGVIPFSLYTFPSPEHATKAIPKALELLEEFIENGITQEETQNAVSALTQGYPFELSTALKRLSFRLREKMTGRKFLRVDSYQQMLKNFKTDQINQIIKNKLSTKNVAISVVGDAKKLKPILKKLPNMKSVTVVEVKA